MKRLQLAALLLASVFSGAALAANEPEVMILGSFHFQGSEADGVSVTMGNVLSERRQDEIRTVVERLARFKPTKIMIEATPDRQDAIDTAYQSYRDGKRELSANESEQLGMRLAAQLDHARVIAVDHMQPMDFERMMKAGAQAGQTDILGWFNQEMGGIEKTLSNAQAADKTILDALRFHNGEWALNGNQLYIKLATLGTTDDPVGAEVIGGWYERNLKIYANIARHLEAGDRALVIYGSGHLAQLNDFFEENPDYKLVSALEYLGQP